MVKKLSVSFAVVGTLLFGMGIVNALVVSPAMAQHYQVLQPDGKDVVKEDQGGKAKGEEMKTGEQKEEMCQKCKHMPSKPEGDCRCDCHHRHQ